MAIDKQAQKTASMRLKGAVWAAKRAWANGVIAQSSLWEVATWRHGRRTTKIPPLRGGEGLTHEHKEMTKIFSKRFLIKTPPNVPFRFTDDPQPLQSQQLLEIRNSLIHDLLAKTTNTSAPGVSGHSWKIVKWVWKATPTQLADLVRASIHAGHHPKEWKEAIVCVVSKPRRADYTISKNYHPISLLKCLGKLVEKIVARLMYQEIIQYDLVPTNQFRGRVTSSTVDAALCLTHDVQSVHIAGLRTGICLSNIAGFFDHVNRLRLVQLIIDLDFTPEIVKWCKSYLEDRRVCLKFNGTLSDPLESDIGNPLRLSNLPSPFRHLHFTTPPQSPRLVEGHPWHVCG
jgi:hypothetical protein